MGSETAYLSLGSNAGDRSAILQWAVANLRAHARMTVAAVSSLYETAPQDVVQQPWFLNQVVAVETDMAPTELLAVLQSWEQAAGRVRAVKERRGPRTLDLDILLFGSLVMAEEALTIPHARLRQRRFVLEPLVEIAPRLTDPESGRLFSEFLQSVGDQELRAVP